MASSWEKESMSLAQESSLFTLVSGSGLMGVAGTPSARRVARGSARVRAVP